MRPVWFRCLGLPMLAGGLLLLADCAISMPVAGPPNPAPPIPDEIVPKPPVSEQPLIWQPGHWDWMGDGYAWREGRWERRAGHGTEWQDGYWVQEGMAWRWVPAHWL